MRICINIERFEEIALGALKKEDQRIDRLVFTGWNDTFEVEAQGKVKEHCFDQDLYDYKKILDIYNEYFKDENLTVAKILRQPPTGYILEVNRNLNEEKPKTAVKK